jgi:hypothetical protein
LFHKKQFLYTQETSPRFITQACCYYDEGFFYVEASEAQKGEPEKRGRGSQSKALNGVL